MSGKLLGGILLIVGTSIGGGMLALPIATAPGGFWGAIIMLFLAWLVMTVGALLILEVNLWLPPGSNIISMAKHTLGLKGEICAWIIYLLLLYSLISAYTASGGGVLHGLLQDAGLNIPQWLATCIFVIIFASIVVMGIKAVDYVNRGLMTGKFIVFVLLIIASVPFIRLAKLDINHPSKWLSGITVIITSFGFATIVPSLRKYFQDDVKQLRKAIIIGSLIPLIAYMIWIVVTLGTLSRHGKLGLLTIAHVNDPVIDLARAIAVSSHNIWVTSFADIFTSICVLTSFLAVSLGLSDFLADGFRMHKVGKQAVVIFCATFLPPLLIVIFYPKAFLLGLSYAGIFCILLLVMLPIIMAWWGRYRKRIDAGYRLLGGKTLLISIFLLSIVFIIFT